MHAHSYFMTEDEVLLLPGTQMVVQSQLNPASDLHIIHLKQVIPKETLLELPFKGIYWIYFLMILSFFPYRCTALSKNEVSLLLIIWI